jgi:hypothetical protein
MFFFEKKNQKTFALLVPRKLHPATPPGTGSWEQKFFGSFFQKRTVSFSY